MPEKLHIISLKPINERLTSESISEPRMKSVWIDVTGPFRPAMRRKLYGIVWLETISQLYVCQTPLGVKIFFFWKFLRTAGLIQSSSLKLSGRTLNILSITSRVWTRNSLDAKTTITTSGVKQPKLIDYQFLTIVVSNKWMILPLFW